MNTRRLHALIATGSAALMLLSGCATPPEAELSVAKSDYNRRHPDHADPRVQQWKVVDDCAIFQFPDLTSNSVDLIAVKRTAPAPPEIAFTSTAGDGVGFDDSDQLWRQRCSK